MIDEIVTLEITEIAYRGKGVARSNGVVVFVKDGLLGEVVNARITSKKKNYWEGVVSEVLNPSPYRIAPCVLTENGERIPGLVYDILDYEAEVATKNEQLRSFLKKVGAETVLDKPFASPKALGYRNKVIFHVQEADGEVKIGYVGDDNKSVTDMASCPLAMASINYSYARVRDEMKRKLKDGDTLTFRATKDGVAFWVNEPPQGTDYLTEATEFGDYLVPANGFFQVNPEVASELVREVANLAKQFTCTTLFDLYCGVGVFGLALAEGFSRIIGIESGREAVCAARENASRRKIKAKYYALSLREGAKRRILDVVDSLAIVDPPRQGMEVEAAQTLAQTKMPIIYVSCDPSTLTRDIKIFQSAGYVVRYAKMFDMFPRTMHFESLVLLSI